MRAVRELFGDGITDLRTERVRAREPFRDTDHFIEFFREYFGPVKTAFEKAGPDNEEELTEELRENLERANTAGDRALVIEPEYLRVIATRA